MPIITTITDVVAEMIDDGTVAVDEGIEIILQVAQEAFALDGGTTTADSGDLDTYGY